jgi:hypothetical protein
LVIATVLAGIVTHRVDGNLACNVNIFSAKSVDLG